MFKNLTDFSYKRNWKEAVGFYLAFFVLLIIISVLLSGMLVVMGLIDGFEEGSRFGTIMAVIFCSIISILLLKKKKLLNNFGYIILSLIGGALLGLIIPAFITTK